MLRRDRPRWRVVTIALLLCAWCVGGAAANQVAVPDLPARPGVPVEVAESLVAAFRAALVESGLRVSVAAIITPGIAGSLEVEFTRLIAELEGTQFAVSGEIVARSGAGGEPFVINILAVDVVRNRTSDLLSRPLAAATVARVANELAALVSAFVSAEIPLGDAGLFVSSEPRDAEVRLDGVPLGRTGSLDVVGLQPGRYELEVRREGYLPEIRFVELRARDTTFVHVTLTEVTGGSIRVTSTPTADVIVDGERVGRTPLTLSSLPGLRTVRLERPGFAPFESTEQVRNFRVTRTDVSLAPLHPTMLVWDTARPGLVVVDGTLRQDGYAEVGVGLVRIELRSAGNTRSFLRAIPALGVHVLDLASGEITPLAR
ncbi:hypothetical protein BH23DEI1_BH23DEI1_00810 [soil metagenome]